MGRTGAILACLVCVVCCEKIDHDHRLASAFLWLMIYLIGTRP